MDNPPEGQLPFLVVPVGSGGRGDRDTVLWKFNPKRGVYVGIVHDEYAVLGTPIFVWPGKPRDDVSFVYESFVPSPSTFEAELGGAPIVLGVVRAIPHAKIRVVQKASGDITCTWPSQKKNTLYTVCVRHDFRPSRRRHAYPIAVLQTKKSLLRMTHSELMCRIKKRHRAFMMMLRDTTLLNGGDVSRISVNHMEDVVSSTMYTNGKPKSFGFSVIIDVTGRDMSGRVVLRASSEPVKVTISDADELKHFAEKRKIGQAEKTEEK